MTSRPRRPWLFPLLALVCIACASKAPRVQRPPYPFENGSPPVTIALLSYPEKERSAGLAQCFARYEGVTLLGEAQVLGALRRARLAPADLERAKSWAALPGLSGMDLFLFLAGTEEAPQLTVVDLRQRALNRYRLERNPRNCEKLLATLGFFRVTSEPSAIDTFIDGRYFGRTPLYAPLSDGKHTIELFSPKHQFLKKEVFPPAEREIHFQGQVREISEQMDEQGDFQGPPGGNERVGTVMMIIGAGALIAGAIFFPLYFLGI